MKTTDDGFVFDCSGRHVECSGTVGISWWGGIDLGVHIDSFIEPEDQPENYTVEEKQELAECMIHAWAEYGNDSIAFVEIRKFGDFNKNKDGKKT